MQTGKADETTTGEARVRVEGGLAHFPGLAKNQTVSFDMLATADRLEITTLADQAGFFDYIPSAGPVRPDARTYTVGLTIAGRSRELRVAEPIKDPALAKLVSTVRRLARVQVGAR